MRVWDCCESERKRRKWTQNKKDKLGKWKVGGIDYPMRNTPQQIPESRSWSSRTEMAAQSRAPTPAPPETPSEPISGNQSRPPLPSFLPIPFPHCSILSLSLSPSSRERNCISSKKKSSRVRNFYWLLLGWDQFSRETKNIKGPNLSAQWRTKAVFS